MKLNIFSSILIFLTASYPGLAICVIIFCISIIILIIKRKKLKIFTKTIFTLLMIISIIFIGIKIYSAIAFGKYHSMAIMGGSDGPTAIYMTYTNNNEFTLSQNDYEIISYTEHDMQRNFKLKIINIEKLNILENSINPVIYIDIDNKTILAKGQLSILSQLSKEYYVFPVDNNGKIEFFEKDTIGFIGFEN
jgi:energy-coupling factor transporter transmembrane protein EcfT